MSQEDQAPEASDSPRHWWPWLLAAALLGTLLSGSLGAAIGLVAEGLLVGLVNRLPANKVRTLIGAFLLIGCGILAGAGCTVVLASTGKLKREMLLLDLLGRGEEFVEVTAWVLIGGTLGGLIASLDRLFVWVVYPYGAEPPTEPIDIPDSDLEPED